MKRIILLLLTAFSLVCGGTAVTIMNGLIIARPIINLGWELLVFIESTKLHLLQSVLENVNADHFQLWRNGEQVAIYTSVQNAPLGGGGYIEFWGEMNDGKPDKPLYREPDYQLFDKFSLADGFGGFFSYS